MKRFLTMPFDKKSRKQTAAFIVLIVLTVCFSFAVCAVSIEGDWAFDYPLPGSVDDYGCYPQMFDAFKKGQLNIDTDYDLSVYERMDNPYDTPARRAATGETFGVTWDRAYYDGKLYSYFGIAPVIFLYFPFYFLTGKVLSDALCAAILSAFSAAALMILLRELLSRLSCKVPYPLLLLGAATVPFGALIWSTQTCANFYHIAVQAGICAVSGTFLFLVYAEKCGNKARKLLFFIAGVCAVCVLGTRPNHILYMAAALPLIIGIIVKRPNGTKSMIFDALAFAAPVVLLGALLMAYNAARFGSPFDFGNDYQLTLWDMSQMTFSFGMILPAFYHYFVHPPLIDGIFPFLHPSGARLSKYVPGRKVYTSGNVGAVYLPCVLGAAYLPYAISKCGKKAKATALCAAAAVIAVAVLDMSYAGVHLRYEADIAYVLAFGGVFGFVAAVGKLRDDGRTGAAAALYTAAVIAFILTVAVDAALSFDNERDMIMHFHKDFYEAVKSFFGG